MKIDEISLKDKDPEEIESMVKIAEENGFAIQIVYETMKIYKRRKNAL